MGDCRNKLIYGRVEVEIIGQNMERFLNISSNRSLLIEQVESHRFMTSPSDFKRMKDVARKTGVHLRIIGRHGLPFFLYRNRMRKLLQIGVVIFLFGLYLSSFFIWDISYEGNRRFTDEMLDGYLESIPIYHGIKKMDISCDALEAGIRNEFSEITWVSAEIRGTRLVIRIKENDVLMNPIEDLEDPCDLIAKSDGIIKKLIVRKGIPQIKVGDVIKKGTLLVDGTIPIHDDSGSLINSHEVHADAEVFAQTIHCFQKEIPLSIIEKTRTGHLRKGGYVSILGNTFFFMLPLKNGQLWEIVKEEKQFHFFDDFYLPIHYGGLSAYEYKKYERYYTQGEAEKIGERSMQEYIEKLSEKGIQILGSDGKIEFNESEWTYTGTITVIENIAIEDRPIGIDEEN